MVRLRARLQFIILDQKKYIFGGHYVKSIEHCEELKSLPETSSPIGSRNMKGIKLYYTILGNRKEIKQAQNLCIDSSVE